MERRGVMGGYYYYLLFSVWAEAGRRTVEPAAAGSPRFRKSKFFV